MKLSNLIKFYTMKPWEYYDNYIEMTLNAGDETRSMEWLFEDLEDEDISPASEFANYVEAVIEQGVPEDNEKEIALQALLMFLCESLGENFVEDEFEADSFSISFEGEVLYAATCSEYVEYCESKGWI